jgi:hypothetical protein
MTSACTWSNPAPRGMSAVVAKSLTTSCMRSHDKTRKSWLKQQWTPQALVRDGHDAPGDIEYRDPRSFTL